MGAPIIVGSDVRVAVLLQCADAESAKQSARLLDDMRTSLGSLALAPVLSQAARRVEVTPVGPLVRLTVALSAAELTPLFDLLLVP